jgi:hypothetical protein
MMDEEFITQARIIRLVTNNFHSNLMMRLPMTLIVKSKRRMCKKLVRIIVVLKNGCTFV